MTANEAVHDAVRTAEALYDDVTRLVKDDPQNTRLLETQVHGATHLISLYGRAKEFDKAQSLFDYLAEIISKKPEPRFRDAKAGAAVSLSAVYGNAGFADKVRAIYNDIKSMAEQYPGEPDLRDYQANIAYNMAIDYLRASQLEPVIEIYNEVTALGNKYPQQMGIQRDRGRILANRIFYLIEETEDIKAARELYRELAELAAAHPEDTYLRRAQADTAVSIIAKIDDSEEESEG